MSAAVWREIVGPDRLLGGTSLVALAGLLSACLPDEPAAPVPRVPVVTSVATLPSSYNVLSNVFAFRATGADSVRVIYQAAGDPMQATPFARVVGESGAIPVLGLLPNTSYSEVLEVAGRDTLVASAPQAFVTGSLPPPLQRVALVTAGAPADGYIMTAFTRDSLAYITAFDTRGAVRWYRQLSLRPTENAVETKQQPNGDFTVFLGATFGWQPTSGRYVEFRPAGDSVTSWTAGPPYYTDNHELLVTGAPRQERAHVFGYDLRRADLTPLGGRPDVLLAGHSIIRRKADGTAEFFWSAWDHFALADWIEIPPNISTLTNTDFDHPNALAIDLDGNYVASFRNLSEITKIDGVTGAILWRFGGRNNQFTIDGDPLGGFAGQHSVRVLPNGHLLVFDNGLHHSPPESRAVEYEMNVAAKTATMAWQFRHSPPIFTPFLGSVQRLRGGNTLIGFSSAGIVTEVSPMGNVLWEATVLLDGNPANFYRVVKVKSLYEFSEP